MSLVKLMSEPEYRQIDAISYSMLSGVDKTPASLLNNEKLDTPSITYGSAVDTLAFDGMDVFNEKFVIMSGESPSKTVETIVREIYTIILQKEGEVNKPLDKYDKLILTVAESHGYGQGSIKWKDETIIRKVKDEGGRKLFDFLQSAGDRKILESYEYQKVLNSVNTLYTHPFTNHWINNNEDKEYEVVYQFPILWNFNGENAKSLFDIIGIDNKNKVLYPIDLKTSFDHVLGFPYNFIKWKYYLQAAFYSDALRYWKLENPEYFNYRIENFRFIIISSQDPFKPLVYRCTDEDLYVGKYGGTNKRNDEPVKGYVQLIEERNWHLETKQFDYPKHIYDKNGEVELNVFV